MASIVSVLEHVAIDRLIRSNTALSGNGKFEWGFAALFSFLICLGSGFLIYAAYLWMLSNYAPETAALFAAGLAFWLALMLGAGAYALYSYKIKRVRKVRQEVGNMIHTAIEALDEELTAPVRENPKTSVLVASLAGFITGEKFI